MVFTTFYDQSNEKTLCWSIVFENFTFHHFRADYYCFYDSHRRHWKKMKTMEKSFLPKLVLPFLYKTLLIHNILLIRLNNVDERVRVCQKQITGVSMFYKKFLNLQTTNNLWRLIKNMFMLEKRNENWHGVKRSEIKEGLVNCVNLESNDVLYSRIYWIIMAYIIYAIHSIIPANLCQLYGGLQTS